MSAGKAKKRNFAPLKDEMDPESQEAPLLFTVIAEEKPAKKIKGSNQNAAATSSGVPELRKAVILTEPAAVEDDSVWQTCSLCGTKVSDLATHIVDDHTELQEMERESGPKKSATRVSTPVRYKGRFRQVKPVLRYPCDACKTVVKSSDQLKKHMILVHNGHKNTSWMFCGDCEYATRVEDELINHVKVHQIFNILKEDFIQTEQPDPEGEDDEYSSTPIECGDCDFTTHYESQMFLHVKQHMGKLDKYGPVNETERKKLEKMEKKDAFVLVEGSTLICSFCIFRTEDRKEIARHLSKVHGTEVDEEGKKIINVRQSFYYCTLCPFKGKTKGELQEHKMITIHNKKGGTCTIQHNPLKPRKVL